MAQRYTNEVLRKKFKNQFELVSYAISLAENMIITGREARVKTDNQNAAMQVLAEIEAGKDQFEPVIPAEKKREERNETPVMVIAEAVTSSSSKGSSEKKRARKILMD